MNFLSGYKSYIVSAVLALVGVTEGLLGFDVPGVTLDQNWVMILLGAAGLSSIRAAIPGK